MMALYFFCTVKAHVLLITFLLLSPPAFLPCIIGIARGRLLLELSEVAQEGEKGGKWMSMEGSMMIGSRPPRCQGICRGCGRCEAVQVPAMPQQQQRNEAGKQFSAVVNTRGDDSSNYKPLSWKCKCGDVILNP